MTLIYAHRGARLAAPENTEVAFQLAGELGADGIELDVRLTADDVAVIHHDSHLADGREVHAVDLRLAAFDPDIAFRPRCLWVTNGEHRTQEFEIRPRLRQRSRCCSPGDRRT